MDRTAGPDDMEFVHLPGICVPPTRSILALHWADERRSTFLCKSDCFLLLESSVNVKLCCNEFEPLNTFIICTFATMHIIRNPPLYPIYGCFVGDLAFFPSNPCLYIFLLNIKDSEESKATELFYHVVA